MVKRGLRWTGLVTLGLLLAAGCSTLVDEDEGAVPIAEIPLKRQGTIPLETGYKDGKEVRFYKMGTFVPSSSGWYPSYDEKFPGMPLGQLYLWTDASGQPTLNNEQLPIIDHLPQASHYSDFLEIVAVYPTDGYVANDIKSRGTLLRTDFELTHTGRVVNCPVVGPETKLESMSGAYRKLKVWYRKQVTYCLLMDGNAWLDKKSGAPVFEVKTGVITDGVDELVVKPRDYYTLVAKAYSGSDFVTGVPVKGNDIFRYTQTSTDCTESRKPICYSPLVKIWNVTVPADYKLRADNSWGDLFPSGEEFTDPRIVASSPEAFCNCPIRP
jgi:hypothetical protein